MVMMHWENWVCSVLPWWTVQQLPRWVSSACRGVQPSQCCWAAPAGLPGAQGRSCSSWSPGRSWVSWAALQHSQLCPCPSVHVWMGTLHWQQSQGQGLIQLAALCFSRAFSVAGKLVLSLLPLIKAASRLMGAVWGSSALSSCTHTGTSCFTQEFCWSCSWLQCRKHRAWNFILFSNQHTATENATFRIF